MKLEFFENGLDGGPMILLYGGAPADVAHLRESIRELSKDARRHIVLSDLPFVQPVGGCRLRITCAERDLGVIDRGGGDFEWALEPESWLTVDEYLDPFCAPRDSVSFQYLNPGRGPEVIYSTARAW